MKTIKNRSVFLVLVPHRDARAEIKKKSESLLKAGLTGLYNFPWVAPLVSLSHSLNPCELKNFARSLRESMDKNKMYIRGTSVTMFDTGTVKLPLYGHRLELFNNNFSFFTSEKIKSFLSPLIIGSFLSPADQRIDNLSSKIDIPLINLSFRAAAVANMYWKTLQINGEIIYKWKICKLFWLPNPIRNNNY